MVMELLFFPFFTVSLTFMLLGGGASIPAKVIQETLLVVT